MNAGYGDDLTTEEVYIMGLCDERDKLKKELEVFKVRSYEPGVSCDLIWYILVCSVSPALTT